MYNPRVAYTGTLSQPDEPAPVVSAGGNVGTEIAVEGLHLGVRGEREASE